MREDDVERVARAIYDSGEWNSDEFWEELGESSRTMFYDAARAAIVAMQPAALPAEPAPGTVRVRVAVRLHPLRSGGFWWTASDSDEPQRPRPPDAILVADVRPLTPPEVPASVEPAP